MTIQKAQVTARAAADPAPILLTLVRDERGWTYTVDGVTGGEFLLDWREDSAEKASGILLERFDPETFCVEVIEET